MDNKQDTLFVRGFARLIAAIGAGVAYITLALFQPGMEVVWPVMGVAIIINLVTNLVAWQIERPKEFRVSVTIVRLPVSDEADKT